MEPLTKDTPNKGHPLYKGHGSCPQNFIPMVLIPPKKDNSLQKTKWLVPKCCLFGGSTVFHQQNPVFTSSHVFMNVVSFTKSDLQVFVKVLINHSATPY